MRLKLIVKSLALAGLLSSSALTPLFAQEAPKRQQPRPNKPTTHSITNFHSLITLILPTHIKALLPQSLLMS